MGVEFDCLKIVELSKLFANLLKDILKTNLMHKFSYLLIVFVILTSLLGCSETKLDYRYKYVGEYRVVFLRIGESGMERGDTMLFVLPCSVDFSEERKSLSFDLPDLSNSFEANIDRKGQLSFLDVESSEFTGEFGDNYNFSIVYKSFDLLGNTFRNELEGTRK